MVVTSNGIVNNSPVKFCDILTLCCIILESLFGVLLLKSFPNIIAIVNIEPIVDVIYPDILYKPVVELIQLNNPSGSVDGTIFKFVWLQRYVIGPSSKPLHEIICHLILVLVFHAYIVCGVVVIYAINAT